MAGYVGTLSRQRVEYWCRDRARLQASIFVQIFWSALSDLLVCVRRLRWNHIGPTRPLAQIDCAAAVATERKFSIAVLHNFLADRAAEFKGSLAWHGRSSDAIESKERPKKLQNPRHQIIVVCFRDLATIKPTGLRLRLFRKLVHEHFAVDLGSMHRSAAFHKQIGLL
jgi:hypothetical protein